MRRRLSVAMGALLTVVMTHGFVYAGCRMDLTLPAGRYQGFFQTAILLIESLWSKTHGWEPLSHIYRFGPWFAKAVHFGCPITGFIAFWLLSRHRIGRKSWKPLVIAAAFASLYALMLPKGLTHSAVWVPPMETALVLAVFMLMIWSVGAFPTPRRLCKGGR